MGYQEGQATLVSVGREIRNLTVKLQTTATFICLLFKVPPHCPGGEMLSGFVCQQGAELPDSTGSKDLLSLPAPLLQELPEDPFPLPSCTETK